MSIKLGFWPSHAYNSAKDVEFCNVLQGSGGLTRARLYLTVCTQRDRGRLDDEVLQ